MIREKSIIWQRYQVNLSNKYDNNKLVMVVYLHLLDYIKQEWWNEKYEDLGNKNKDETIDPGRYIETRCLPPGINLKQFINRNG